MTKKTRDRIVKLAQRMLAIQLEISPRAATNICFGHSGYWMRISKFRDGRWICVAEHRRVPFEPDQKIPI